MDFSSVLPGLVGTLVSAGSLFLLGWVYPSTRWTRRIKRDIAIMSGLPEGEERREWEFGVSALARRLRLYEKHVPVWHKVYPFSLAILYGVMIAWFIADEPSRNALLAETPAFILGIGSLVGSIGYLYVAIAGGDMHGRSPEQLEAREKRRQRRLRSRR